MRKYLPILLLAGSTTVFAIDERIEALKQALLRTIPSAIVRTSMAQKEAAQSEREQVKAKDTEIYRGYME